MQGWFCTSEMLCERRFLPWGSEGRVNALEICKSTHRDLEGFPDGFLGAKGLWQVEKGMQGWACPARPSRRHKV